MGELWLMRHGWAEDSHAQGDGERALSASGEQDIQWLGRLVLQQHRLPSVIWTSPLRRARQTANLLREIWQAKQMTASQQEEIQLQVTPLLAPGLQPEHLDHSKLATMWPAYEQIVLWIGHWPDMALLAGWLSFGCTHQGIALQPGALAMLQCRGRFGPERAQLSQLWSPHHFRPMQQDR